MLSASHRRAYQELMTWLTKFDSLLPNQNCEVAQPQIRLEFQSLTQWFNQNIANLSSEGLERAIAPRWQSVQTEIKREFKLLTTDILFFASARQNPTQTKRLKSISDRLNKLIGYCQIMLNDGN